jgi:hypothetical protein
MATQVDTFIIDVQAKTDEIKQLQKDIAQLKMLMSTGASHPVLQSELNDLTIKLQAARNALNDLKQAQTQATTATVASVTPYNYATSAIYRSQTATAAAGMGSMHYARAMAHAARVSTHFGSSISAVIASMSGLTLTLGGGAGLAAGISAVVIGIQQVTKHWDELNELFGRSKTLSEAEAMKQLADATARTATEQSQLNRLRAEQGALGSIRDSPILAAADQAQNKRFGDVLAEHGTAGILDPLVSGLTRNSQIDRGTLDPELRDALDKAYADVIRSLATGRDASDPGVAREMSKVEELRGQAYQQMGEKMLADAMSSPAGAARLADQMTKLGAAPEVVDDIRSVLAGGITAAEGEKEAAEERERLQRMEADQFNRIREGEQAEAQRREAADRQWAADKAKNEEDVAAYEAKALDRARKKAEGIDLGPGLSQRIQDDLIRGFGSEAITGGLSRTWQKHGMGADEADLAAADRVERERKAVEEQLFNLQRNFQPQMARVQQMGAQDFGRYLQGQDPATESLSVQKQMEQHLQRIVQDRLFSGPARIGR